MTRHELDHLKVGDVGMWFMDGEAQDAAYIVTQKTHDGRAIAVSTVSIGPENCDGWDRGTSDHRNETEDFMEYKVTLRGKPPKIVAIPVKVIRLGTLPLGMSEFDYRLMLLREYCNKSGTPFYGEFPIDWELK